MQMITRDRMFYKFSLYGFLKNLRFFDPFILLIFRSYGLSFLQIGILYSIREVATNILEIPTGVIADSFGRRRSMVAAFLSYITSFLIFYFLKDFIFLALAMVMFAFGEAFRSGTHKALIFEYLNIQGISDLKVAYYGLTRSASQFGSALNALIAAALIFYTGSYRVMFLASTVPYLLDLLNVMSYPKSLDGELHRAKKGEIWSQVKTTSHEFIRIFSDRSVMKAILNSASFSGVFKSAKDYLQPILAVLAISASVFTGLEDTQREAVIIGLVYFGIYFLTSIASRRAYQFSERFSSLSQAVNFTYLLGAGMLILAGVTANLQIITLSVVCFLGLFMINNIRRPINVGIISDQISSKVMASGLSTESQFTTIFSAIVAPLLGFLVDSFGVGNGITLIGTGMIAIFLLVRVK
ncbi:MAG: MFS transporter [Anaerolineales bacterium]|nr:MFS transporter [Anaerolineales bacterium]